MLLKRKAIILLASIMAISFLVACGPKEDDKEDGEIEMDIKDVHEQVKEEFGQDYLPSMSLSLEELSDLTGIEKDSVEDFIAEVPMMNVHVDTFIAIEAKKDDAYDVAQTLLKYQEYLNEEALQYPMNIAKVKASKVERKGDYVFFIMLGAPNEFEDQESQEALEFSQREVAKVQAIINKACG